MTTTATLISGPAPRLVQVVVSATTNGVAWTVTGTAGSYSWTVPGGAGVGDGNQLVLVDNRGPLNVPITYTYTPETGSAQAAAPVTRTSNADITLQSTDGQKSVGANLMYGSKDSALEIRNALFSVPGRPRPVVRYSTTGAGGGALVIRVHTDDSETFADLLADGSPIIWLLGKPTFDLPPVESILITGASNSGMPVISMREWTLPYVLVDDPFMDTRLGAFTWADFDAAMADDTWGQFATAFAGKTWKQFDTQDWGIL